MQLQHSYVMCRYLHLLLQLVQDQQLPSCLQVSICE